MFRRSAFTLVAATAAAFSIGASGAAAQTVGQSTGTAYEATAMTGFATSGSMMDGMEIFGIGTGGSVFSGTWGLLGSGFYGVETSLFTVFMQGTTDSFSSLAWRVIANQDLYGLTFRGAGGNTVFDRFTGGSQFTPGSSTGRDFAFGSDLWNTDVLYTNAIGVGGNAPLGDVYERVDVTFGTVMTAGTNTAYSMDTDNARATDPGDVFVPVPEPANAALLLSGLLGIGLVGVGRRRLGSST